MQTDSEPTPLRYEYVSDLPALHSLVNAMSFSPDGNLLATGAADGKLIVYSIPSLEIDQKLEHISSILCLAWVSEKKFLVGFQSGEIYILERCALQQVRKL